MTHSESMGMGASCGPGAIAFGDGAQGVSAHSGNAPSRGPVRIQLRRTKGWRKPENTVSVARPGKWGNPYRVERVSGQLWDPVTTTWSERWEMRCLHWLRGTIYPTKLQAVERAVRLFRSEVAPYLKTDELRGKNLACWCPLDQPCHADVLLELANRDRDGAEGGDANAAPVPQDRQAWAEGIAR
jgi:hypothetical protein